MRTKISLAVSSALFTVSALHSGTTFANNVSNTAVKLTAAPVLSVNKNKRNKVANVKKINIDKRLGQGVYTYIIQLNDAPLATYNGEIKGLAATNPQTAKKSYFATLKSSSLPPNEIRDKLRLNVTSYEAIQYANYLTAKQQAFQSKAIKTLGQQLDVKYQYRNVINGLAVNLTQAQAIELSKLPDVTFIQREKRETLHTDTGPTHIGAPSVWDGTATGVGAMGEGVVIGVLDTGVNTDHPSFADIGGDGYDHTNPRGENNYVGDCVQGFPELCNDKLIGVRSYTSITNDYNDNSVFGDTPPPANGEDYNGHGSHTASTAGGNVLPNTPMYAPNIGQVEGDGVASDFTFEQVSGVAPHANIISYQICAPGENGDTYSGCPTSAILAALEDAVRDNVDVINFSISGGGNPWQDTTELAFLSAQEAGIFSAVSAGNGGPGEYTTPKNAPWYTVVGASTHGRTITGDKSIGSFSGGSTNLSDISGQSISGGITAEIVYAGDFTNSNDPDGDSAQCLKPFPENTFTGQIVVCDRGDIARVEKAANVSSGGAGGYVLANISGGSTNLEDDIYVIPGIHINANNGNSLKSWLASGSGHQATITEGGKVNIGQADNMASFSSRGPNLTVNNVLTPSVTAPGVSIYAASADQMFGHDVTTPEPSDFAFLSGTSMSSPHVAGAAALLKSAHPTWTVDNIRSALMMTASLDVRKENASTPADHFDMGAGSIRVNLAAQTGLVMNESAANYTAANPNLGGDPKTLNIPSLTNTSCLGTCTWTRTVTATKDGIWNVNGTSVNGNLAVTVSPTSFEISQGESQVLTITADSSNSSSQDWSFAKVELTSETHPTLHLPVSVVALKGTIPENASFTTNRQADGGVLSNVTALEITDFTARSFGLTKATLSQDTIAKDSNNDSIYDDNKDGLSTQLFTIPENAKRFLMEITESESPDMDLIVGIDSNGDGIAQESEQLTYSATSTSMERIDLIQPDPGSYWVVIQNWASSGPEAEDSFTLATAIIDGEIKEGLNAIADSAISQLQPFDIAITWQLDNAQEGDKFYGALDLGSTADNAGNLGVIAVDILKQEDDVEISNDATGRVNAGDTVNYTINVLANTDASAKNYTISATIPDGLTLVENSATNNPTISGEQLTWQLTQTSIFGQNSRYTMTSNDRDASCKMPDVGQATEGGYIDLAELGHLPSDATGDSQTTSFEATTSFFGKSYDVINATDDGFVFFSGTSGSEPWVNQRLPSSTAPNHLVAPLWRDMQLASSETTGITVATADHYTIVEWDDMLHWQFYDGNTDVTDIADFEVVFDNSNSNFYFAYDNVLHTFGDVLGVTVGYENQDGSFGDNHIYQGSSGAINSVTNIQSGLVLCYQYQPVDLPTTLTFSVTVDSDFAGGSSTILLSHDVDSSYTQSESGELAPIDVEGAPSAVISGVTSAIGSTRITLSAAESSDPNDDNLTYSWSQSAGTSVTFSGSGESISFTTPSTAGQITIDLTVNDGNGNTATTSHNISITAASTGNGGSNSGGGSGGGSIFWLLTLIALLPLRKAKLKIK